MSQQTQAPQELSRYANLPVTVISEPVNAIRESKRQETSDPKKCAWATGIQPVVDGKKQLVGIRKLRTGLDMAMLSELDGAFHGNENDTLDEICREFPQLPDTAPVSQAQALFGLGHWQHIPLVNAEGKYTGHCASLKRLNDLLEGTARPVRIGGLATPLGVYMTSGLYSAGSGVKGLIATGVMFAIVAHLLDYWLFLVFKILNTWLPWFSHLKEGMHLTLETGLAMVSFIALIRLTPMSGLHAAEHMTINAIEHDLPLLPPYVRSQPRKHPRCGTNLMVLLGGVEMVGLFLWATWHEMNPLGKVIYATIGLIVVFKFWQPAGLWLQQNFTTKDPTDAQLESGIKAGQALLEKYRAEPHPYPSLGRRLLSSGMVHMAVTFLASAWLIGWLVELAQSGLKH